MRFWFKKGAWASKKAYTVIDGLKAEDVRSIAVIRHSALGDMMLTRPFFVETRKAFPNAKITISVLESYTRGVPDDLVDRVHIVFNKKPNRLSFKSRLQNLRELGDHDILFDLADTSRSLLLCLLNKARLKIGFPYRSVYRHLFYDATVFRSDFIFEADLLLHMLNLLGVKTALPPDFNITHIAHKRDAPYLVYFTGASTPLKCWSLENFRQLILKISKIYQDCDHIILKGIGDEKSTAELLKGLEKESNIKNAEINELDKTISFIKGATMLVSNDTGIRHIAIASRTPTVGIFFGVGKGSTQPYRYWPRYGKHEIVYNSNGTEPSLDSVFAATRQLFDNIQSENKDHRKDQ